MCLEKAEGLSFHRFRSSGLTPTLLEKAFGLLRIASGRLGPPREDGGSLFDGVSRAATRLVSRHRMVAAGGVGANDRKLKSLRLDYKLLPRRMDIDTPEDLRRLRSDPAILDNILCVISPTIYNVSGISFYDEASRRNEI